MPIVVGPDMGDRSQRMVWIDLEMTGLDITKESIIEIATVITDSDLNILAQADLILRLQSPKNYWLVWMNGILPITITADY